MNRRYYDYNEAFVELKKYKSKGYQGFVQKFDGMNNIIWYEICVWK